MQYSELRCERCCCRTGVFYLENGAPFYQLFYCESCIEGIQQEYSEEDNNA